MNENEWISIKISLKFVPKGPINNIPALVQIMTWRRPGDKPLSEAMVVSSLMHICVTLPQSVNTLFICEVLIQPRCLVLKCIFTVKVYFCNKCVVILTHLEPPGLFLHFIFGKYSTVSF